MDTTVELYRIVEFIREKAGVGAFRGGFVGLSGGIDSTVCAALMVKAFGSDKVFGLAMPERDSNPLDEVDAKKVADWLGIQFEVKHITPILEYLNTYEFTKRFDFEKDIKPWLMGDTFAMTYQKDHPYVMKLRTRMLVGADYSRRLNYFQCQTINKTEKLLGWGDPFGDMAGDIAPIEHLWKTEVYELAEILEVPTYIIERSSGSGNFPLSNFETIQGMTFKECDEILKRIICQRSPNEIAYQTQLPIQSVLRIWREWRSAQFKSNVPHRLPRERRTNETNSYQIEFRMW